jgi:hypothetical protein
VPCIAVQRLARTAGPYGPVEMSIVSVEVYVAA